MKFRIIILIIFLINFKIQGQQLVDQKLTTLLSVITTDSSAEQVIFNYENLRIAYLFANKQFVKHVTNYPEFYSKITATKLSELPLVVSGDHEIHVFFDVFYLALIDPELSLKVFLIKKLKIKESDAFIVLRTTSLSMSKVDKVNYFELKFWLKRVNDDWRIVKRTITPTKFEKIWGK